MTHGVQLFDRVLKKYFVLTSHTIKMTQFYLKVIRLGSVPASNTVQREIEFTDKLCHKTAKSGVRLGSATDQLAHTVGLYRLNAILSR